MTEQSPIERVKDGVRIKLSVTPRAGSEGLDGIVADAQGHPRLRLRVTAPPAEGEANEAVRRLIAKSLRLPASAIAIISGARGRNKTVHIRGEADHLVPRLATWIGEKT
jgi:hypothetical protein